MNITEILIGVGFVAAGFLGGFLMRKGINRRDEDFRTKAEAMEKLIHIKRVFPAAFIVKEKIRFPHVDRAVLDDLPDSLDVFKL